MASTERLREYILDEYCEHFDAWLVDFKKTSSTYSDFVVGYEGDLTEIYGRLNRIFKKTYWNKRKSMVKPSAVEDDVWRTISDDELTGYILRRHYRFPSWV